MRLSTSIHYTQGYRRMAEEVVELEKAGVDTFWFAESYSVDSVSAMGYYAALTDRATLASGILNIYSRTPAALAMTAAGLDELSQGRFMLGLGASGPQVIEGFHGVTFDAPVTRLRETVDVCHQIWQREQKLEYTGRTIQIPVPAGAGSGLGKPLKLINHPLRAHIPIALATLGRQSVEMTAEIADAWLPAFYMPEGAHSVWGDALQRGQEKRDPNRAPLAIYAGGPVAIGDNLTQLRAQARPRIALYIGGMGAKDKNFYNQIFRQYGFTDEAETIAQLYLSGRKDAAAAAIPEHFIETTSLIGSPGYVRDRLTQYRAAGVTDLHVSFMGTTRAERVRHCDTLKNMIEQF